MNDLLFTWNQLKENYKELKFDERTHTYLVNGEKYPSVTGLISQFYDKFDTEAEALKYSEKHNLSYENIIKAWEGEGNIATTKGTRVHLFGEDYVKWKYFGIDIPEPIASCKQCLAVIQFWTDLPDYIVPVALELQMFAKQWKLCGTADILLYNTKTDSFIIADYKTNKELFGNNLYERKPLHYLGTTNRLYQDNFGKYSLQLSFYQILMSLIGINVTERWIIWLQEGDNKKLYTKKPTKDLTNELTNWLNENRIFNKL